MGGGSGGSVADGDGGDRSQHVRHTQVYATAGGFTVHSEQQLLEK